MSEINLSKVKIGKKVSFDRRNGEQASGKVTDINQGRTGVFYHVNTSEVRGYEKITKIRGTQITAIL